MAAAVVGIPVAAAAAAGIKPLVGIGYRGPLAEWIDARPPEIGCVEIVAEHFFDDRDGFSLGRLRARYPLLVHGLGLSLGTPGPLDGAYLDRFAGVCGAAEPLWVSEHVAFTRTRDVDLGHLNPVPPTRATVRLIADHVEEVVERCGTPMLLENITSHLRLEGPLSEPDLLNEICEAADCGLLLDVTNLFVNARNHHFDPVSWYREIDPTRIIQLHVVGYTLRNGRWEDHHAEPIQSELFELVQEVLDYAPVQAIVLERDTQFPPVEEIAQELRTLEQCIADK